MTNNPTIDGVCKTCLGGGKEYDGAAHTCTACNGISKPAVETCKVVAWRGVNECGDIVTEWIDGEPTPSVDLFGRPASYYKVELAYAGDLQVEVERLQRAEKNDLIAYKAAIEKQKELRDEIKSLRDSEDKWYQNSVNLTVERDALQSTIDQLQARIKELELDKDRLDALDSNCWDVRFGSTPNGDAGDSSINIEVVGHWMDKPFERVIGENYSENLRAAIDQAMKAPAYPPERPEYPEIYACLDATAALNGELK